MKNTIWKFLNEYFDVFSLILKIRDENPSDVISTIIAMYEESEIEDPKEIHKHMSEIRHNLELRFKTKYVEVLSTDHDDKAESYLHLNNILCNIEGEQYVEDSKIKMSEKKQVFIKTYGDVDKFNETVQEMEQEDEKTKTGVEKEIDQKLSLLCNTSKQPDNICLDYKL